MHANAAGIDIGAQEHLVAVAPGRSQEPVRAFGSFTGELLRMAEWLHDCGVQTVVMQSTGVYWMPVYEVLEQAGFAVWLVNARHTHNLPGRKSDVQESQWLLKLHSYGMLNNSFLPSNEIRVLRRYWRQRDLHVKAAGSSIQRIQKVLTEMNVQLGNVVSDPSGETGMAIVRAIAGGERNAEKLAKLRNYRLRASEQEVARSLQGNWREELLFVLKQEIDIYDQYRQRIRECDEQLQGYLRTFADRPSRVPAEPPSRSGAPAAAGARRRKAKGNQSNFDLHSELKRIGGVDLTKIDGIDVIAAQTTLSEVGLDLGRWKTEAHFASWLGYRAATVLRMAALSLLRSQSYLGAQYRRFRTKLGAPKAITAMAHKLARIVYRVLRYGEDYVDGGTALYEEQFRLRQTRSLQQKAAQFGFQLVEI